MNCLPHSSSLLRHFVRCSFGPALLVAMFSWVLLGSCAERNPVLRQSISGYILLGKDEQIIRFARPFKPTKQVSKVCFNFIDKMHAFDVARMPRFPDGVPLELKASIGATNGTRFDLSHVEASVDGTLCLTPDGDAWSDVARTNLEFNELAASSNLPLHIANIEWVSYSTWEFK